MLEVAIAEARNFCDAKLAQEEVMHKSALSRVFEAEASTLLQAEYGRSRQRAIADLMSTFLEEHGLRSAEPREATTS